MCKILIEKIYLKFKRNLAYVDTFTNTFNRNYFAREFEKKYQKLECLLVFVDINNLKLVNDTSGHIFGDNLILEVSNELKKWTDEIIRFGGDEFLFVIKPSNLESFKKWADNQILFSYGISKKEIGGNLNESIVKADFNMMENKKLKKNINK